MAQELVVESRSYLPASMEAVEAVVDRLRVVHELMRKAMTPSVDYGQIPGTNSKPTLLKSGAEKLCVMFRLCPRYVTTKTFFGEHMMVETTCTITNLDGDTLGQASSVCSTKESKYAYRKSERTCPACGAAAIIKGKAEYGGGWLCFTKKGGCNAKYADRHPDIIGQPVGRVQNDDLADSYNTVIRIAEKRAYIAAVRLVTGTSSLFDEEVPEVESDGEIVEPKKQNGKTPDKAFDATEQITRIGELFAILKYAKNREAQFASWASSKRVNTFVAMNERELGILVKELESRVPEDIVNERSEESESEREQAPVGDACES